MDLQQFLMYMHCTRPIRVLDEKTGELLYDGKSFDCELRDYKVVEFYPDYVRDGDMIFVYLTFEVRRTEEKIIE